MAWNPVTDIYKWACLKNKELPEKRVKTAPCTTLWKAIPPSWWRCCFVKTGSCNCIIVYCPLKSFRSRSRRLIWRSNLAFISESPLAAHMLLWKGQPCSRWLFYEINLEHLHTYILAPVRETFASLTWCSKRHTLSAFPYKLCILLPSAITTLFFIAVSLICHNICLKLSQGTTDF